MSIAHDLFLASDLKIFPPGKNDKADQELWNSSYSHLNEEQRKKWEAYYGPKNKAFYNANFTGKDLVRYKYQRFIKDYLRVVASADKNIGRILNYLDKTNLSKNTIVIYTSDQGFFLGEHGWFDKRFMYEESIRMPLLVRYPREIKPGSVTDAMVLNLDFAPTFLDFAGVPEPEDMQGRSLRALLKGKTPEDFRTSMYYHYYEYPGWHMVKRHYGVRTKRYKLIHFYDDISAWEMYDLEEDPDELHNVYADRAYTNTKKQLKNELNSLREKFGDSDELTKRFLQEYPGEKPMIYRYLKVEKQ